MSLPELTFDRDWTKPADFPSYESDETVVRADLQALFNEIRDYINDELLGAIMSEIAQAQTSGVAAGGIKTYHFDSGSTGGTPNSVAPYAAALSPARSFVIQDNDGSHSAQVDGQSLGGATVTFKLPATIKAALDGLAATATKLATARSMTVKDNSEAHSGASVSFDGSGNIVLKLPATIAADIVGTLTGSVTGNAATATKLASAFTVTLSDGSHSGTAQSVDGSAAVTLPLPATIGAHINAGRIVLNSDSYGTELPSPGTPGRLFFKKVST